MMVLLELRFLVLKVVLFVVRMKCVLFFVVVGLVFSVVSVLGVEFVGVMVIWILLV